MLGDDRSTPRRRPPRPALERFDLTSRRTEHARRRRRPVRRRPATASASSSSTTHEMRVVPADRKVRRRKRRSPTTSSPSTCPGCASPSTPGAEWRQMYDEAGRLMRDHYCRADMNGVDWDGRPRPLPAAGRARSDPPTTSSTCCGRCRASSAPRTPTSGARPPDERRAARGCSAPTLAPDGDGRWRVRPHPARRAVRPAGPLAADGAGRGGRRRRRHRRRRRPSGRPALGSGGAARRHRRQARRADRRSTPDGERPRRSSSRRSPTRRRCATRRGSADRRAFTHERSDGRLGYLHVPDMMSPGWAQLHRDLRVEMARDGLILDLRDNGGGHTSQLVVEKFARRIIGWDAQPRLRAGVLPAGLAARPGRHRRRRARRLRRRHRHGGDQGARARTGRRHADVGRRRRHRRPVHARRRHGGHPAALRLLARGLRVGRRELRRRPRHRGRAQSRRHRRRPRPAAGAGDRHRPRRPRRPPGTHRPRPRPAALDERLSRVGQRKAAITGAKRSMPPSATSGSDTIAVCTPASANVR